jgi:hypothetical protein
MAGIILTQQQPDVVHFVDPIWLGAQTLMAMELGWAGEYVYNHIRKLISGNGSVSVVQPWEEVYQEQ